MWGQNDKGEKVLIAMALRAADNIVDVYTFPFESTSEDFYNLMLNEWRESHDVPFPETYTHTELPLTVTGSILPEGYSVERNDVIQRAQSEWHFVVLSDKLYRSFLSELEDFRQGIDRMTEYQQKWWDQMKQIWERIQKNIFDKTLLRDHGQQLRDMTNDIFALLKEKRQSLDNEKAKLSSEVATAISSKLDEIEEKINKGMGLKPLFNDLKKIQDDFKTGALNRNDRTKLWKRLDQAFKIVKEKRGIDKDKGGDGQGAERLDRRLQGLVTAIEKMEKSIQRDENDHRYENDRISNADNQLEAQIRVAKLRMIDERLQSKKEKLAEMLKTKANIESRIAREKKREEELKARQALKEELKEAKESVKQKIAETIQIQAEQVDVEALEKAAEAISGKGEDDISQDVADAINNS